MPILVSRALDLVLVEEVEVFRVGAEVEEAAAAVAPWWKRLGQGGSGLVCRRSGMSERRG
jgi:hypothetical protein